MLNLLTRLRESQSGGIFAVCSAHPMVLESAMEMARAQGFPLLVEATANQVNPFGGYSGMTPADYAATVRESAAGIGLPAEQVWIGADHLGPHVWKHEPAAVALAKAATLARQCVQAGFHKIHLDTVQGCADDGLERLPLEETARRAAQLCQAAESAAGQPPLYVIGDEAPPPGGGLEEGCPVTVTDPEHLPAALDVYERAFRTAGVASAWPRVMAMVVQPGVEFGDRHVAPYRPERAAALSAAHARLPGIMTFEVHATDYQTPQALKQMVRDHFKLLKVGPCLTFALRRALYALSRLEAAIGEIETPTRLPDVMERLMATQPKHWQSHYKGNPETLYQLRHSSLRDRIRYYWSRPEANQAVDQLLRNLRRPIADTLLRRHLPEPHLLSQPGHGRFDPVKAIKAAIQEALQPHADACRF